MEVPILRHHFEIVFEGEKGSDAGGLTNEFFSLLSKIFRTDKQI